MVNLDGGGANPTVEIKIEGDTDSRVELVVPGANVGTFVPYLGAINGLNLGVFNFTTSGSYLGDGSFLSGIVTSEVDPLWTGNLSSYLPLINNSIVNALHRHTELVAPDGNPDPALSVDSIGRVGIGTSSPAGTLELLTGNSIIRIRDSGWTNDSTTSYIEFGGTDGGVWNRTGYVGDTSSGDVNIRLIAEHGDLVLGDSSGASVLTLQGGNVGINTTTPQNKLNVIGDINFTGLIYGNGSQLTDVVGSPDASWLANWTAYNSSAWTTTDSEIWSVASNGTFANIDEPLWKANWTAYNSTWSSSAETTWIANWTAYNTTWSTDTTYSQGTNMSFDGTTINWDGSWALSIFAKIVQLLDYVRWDVIWSQVYNETEVDAINTSMDNRVINTNATMKSYVNTEDTRFNTSMKNYVDGEFITELHDDTTPQLGGYLDADGENIGSTSDEIENIYVGDTTRIYFGDGQDSSIYYNGTTLIISG